MCLHCLAQGRITTAELETHHIVPVEENDALALDDDNLITLSNPQHSKGKPKGVQATG